IQSGPKLLSEIRGSDEPPSNLSCTQQLQRPEVSFPNAAKGRVRLLRLHTPPLAASAKRTGHHEGGSTATSAPSPEEPPPIAPDHHRSSSSPRAREELPLFENTPTATGYGVVGDSKRHRNCNPSCCQLHRSPSRSSPAATPTPTLFLFRIRGRKSPLTLRRRRCPRRRCFLTGATNAVLLHQRRNPFAFPTLERETKPNSQHCIIRHPHPRYPSSFFLIIFTVMGFSSSVITVCQNGLVSFEAGEGPTEQGICWFHSLVFV
ncbi:hypothetical protein V8G54_025193, partial [Vigna mungo]